MVILNTGDVRMKTKKRKRQPEETSIDSFESPSKQDKACQVNLYEQSIEEEYGETNNVIKSKRKKKRKTVQGEVDETNGEIHSAIQKKETIEAGNVNSVNNDSEKIKSKKKRKKKFGSQESLTEKVADISKEVPNLLVKGEENNETVDCDIMLNVTNEPVKANANKDFFNDVHSKIQNISRRKKNRMSAPEEHLVLGDLESQLDNHERHEEGVKLAFKKSNMSVKTLSYNRSNSFAKTTYKQLIKGDLVLHFKNSNLHEVDGYGKSQGK